MNIFTYFYPKYENDIYGKLKPTKSDWIIRIIRASDNAEIILRYTECTHCTVLHRLAELDLLPKNKWFQFWKKDNKFVSIIRDTHELVHQFDFSFD